MKKLIALTLSILCLTGCTPSSSVTKTCSLPSNVDTITLKGTNETLESLTDAFVVDLSDYDEDYQQQLAQSLLLVYGYTDGITYDYTLNDGQLSVSIEIDLNKVSKEDLSSIGLDFQSHLDSNMQTVIESFEADGYICK